jgi:hypothetical protein
MTRKWYVGVPVVLVALTVAMAASAEPRRAAGVGERMGFLVTGLGNIGGPIGSCAAGTPVGSYVKYIVPGRPANDDNASLQSFAMGDHLVAVVAHDERGLNTLVAVYAAIDWNSLITNMWPVANVPAPCAMGQGLHYRP